MSYSIEKILDLLNSLPDEDKEPILKSFFFKLQKTSHIRNKLLGDRKRADLSSDEKFELDVAEILYDSDNQKWLSNMVSFSKIYQTWKLIIGFQLGPHYVYHLETVRSEDSKGKPSIRVLKNIPVDQTLHTGDIAEGLDRYLLNSVVETSSEVTGLPVFKSVDDFLGSLDGIVLSESQYIADTTRRGQANFIIFPNSIANYFQYTPGSILEKISSDKLNHLEFSKQIKNMNVFFGKNINDIIVGYNGVATADTGMVFKLKSIFENPSVDMKFNLNQITEKGFKTLVLDPVTYEEKEKILSLEEVLEMRERLNQVRYKISFSTYMPKNANCYFRKIPLKFE